jgi:hypothetical protein
MASWISVTRICLPDSVLLRRCAMDGFCWMMGTYCFRNYVVVAAAACSHTCNTVPSIEWWYGVKLPRQGWWWLAMLYSSLIATILTCGQTLQMLKTDFFSKYIPIWKVQVLKQASTVTSYDSYELHLEKHSLFAWAENKRLKVLLVDLCERKILLAGWK